MAMAAINADRAASLQLQKFQEATRLAFAWGDLAPGVLLQPHESEKLLAGASLAINALPHATQSLSVDTEPAMGIGKRVYE